METRLVKRQRNAQQAAERERIAALERDFAGFVRLGVPPGVVRKVLPMARLLRRVLPLPDDMVDQVALHYLWDLRRPIRQMWSYMSPLAGTTVDYGSEVYESNEIGIDYTVRWATRDLRVRGIPGVSTALDRLISSALFMMSTIDGVITTGRWVAQNDWYDLDERQARGSSPFFPPDNRPRRQFRYGYGQ